MSKTITIDFSSITEVKANGVDLTAIYTVEVLSYRPEDTKTTLVWSKSNTVIIKFTFYGLDGRPMYYSQKVLSGTDWASYTEINPDFFLITADPSTDRNARVGFVYTTLHYYLLRNGELVRGEDLIMDGEYTLLPRA